MAKTPKKTPTNESALMLLVKGPYDKIALADSIAQKIEKTSVAVQRLAGVTSLSRDIREQLILIGAALHSTAMHQDIISKKK